MALGKWIGGGLGWAFGGPIGAIFGFAVGAMFDRMQKGGVNLDGKTQAGDFMASFLVLSAAMMKADGRVLRSELNYVKDFLRKEFGPNKTQSYLDTLKELLEQDINMKEVCIQIGNNMDYASKLQLIAFILGIANADGNIAASEKSFAQQMAGCMGIGTQDFYSIYSMYVEEPRTAREPRQAQETAYHILQVEPKASDEEVKKAYRKLAKEYHPDKVSHLGEELQEAAKLKFQKLNNAYETIKTARGMA